MVRAAVFLVATAFVAGPLGASGGNASNNGGGRAGWSIVPTPNPSGFNYVYAAAGSSSSDVWLGGGQAHDPFTEHFDGTAWTVVPIPNPGTSAAEVQGLAAVAPGDAWAVGGTGYPGSAAFAEHWDGTRWSIVQTPLLDSGHLEAVAAVSTDDVWAVGGQYDGALFEHWDGSTWKVIPAPLAAEPNAISAVSATNIWTVGRMPGLVPGLQHFDGRRWRVIPGPKVRIGSQGKLGIVALSSRDVWIAYTMPIGHLGTFVIGASHWDGFTWTSERVSTEHASDYSSVGLAGSASGDVWCVGTAGPAHEPGRTFTAHYDGSGWSVVPSPNPGSYADALTAVVVPPGGQPWAVGYASPAFSGVDTLAMRFLG